MQKKEGVQKWFCDYRSFLFHLRTKGTLGKEAGKEKGVAFVL
jgi:hypothetical protein